LKFLLEIGTEEIFDWMIIPVLNSLQYIFQDLLDDHGLSGKVASVDARPRRWVLRARSARAPAGQRSVRARSAEIGQRRNGCRIRQENGDHARSTENRKHYQGRLLRAYKTNPRPGDNYDSGAGIIQSDI
jgi:glycyl-tRNA synthetase beta subunit